MVGGPGKSKITGDDSTVPWAFSLWALFKSQLREAEPHSRAPAWRRKQIRFQGGRQDRNLWGRVLEKKMHKKKLHQYA